MTYKSVKLLCSGLLCAAVTLTACAGVSDDTATTQATTSQVSEEKSMSKHMPSSDNYTGLSRKVLQYSERFSALVNKTKQPGFSDADWAPIEQLVDVDNFERLGVFLGATAEKIDWKTYKKYVSLYGAATSWDGSVRRITEVPGLVILELEERNTANGKTDISNTVTIYKFNEAGKLTYLDVYVMPLP